MKYLGRIETLDANAYIKRLNWRVLDKKVTEVFNFSRLFGDTSSNIRFYLTREDSIDKEAKKFPKYQRLQSIHLSAGWHLLNCWGVSNDGGSFKRITESGANLTYSQNASGVVFVYVTPFKSFLHSVDEERIFIGFYLDPCLISTKDVLRHFRVFLRYCEATTISSPMTLRSFLFRKYLIFNDVRFRPGNLSMVFRYVVRFIAYMVVLLVTLYAGGKLADFFKWVL